MIMSHNKIRVQFDFNLFLRHGYIGLGYVICHQPIENKYTKYLFRQVDNLFCDQTLLRYKGMRTKFHQIAQLQAIQCSKKGKKYCNENICKIGTKYPLAKNNTISKAKKSRCLKIYSILLYSLSPPINAHSKLRLALFRKKKH